jgi:hypothetical protein
MYSLKRHNEICFQSRCLKTNALIKKMWHIHTVEYYSGIKNEIMMSAGKWVELENTISSMVCLAQKETNIIYVHSCEI